MLELVEVLVVGAALGVSFFSGDEDGAGLGVVKLVAKLLGGA